MENKLTTEIKSWIKKNGYPFEMQVAKSFKKAGFEISQSILYKDSNTNKLRETDVIAHKFVRINDVAFNISFIIECKKSVGKPWIIFTNKELYSLHNKKYPILASKNGHLLINEILNHNDYKSPIIFPEIKKAGYSLVTAFNNNKDLSYSATQSVVKACEYFVEKSNNSDNKFCNIYIPVIAVEGDVFEAFLDDNDEIELNKLNVSSVVFTKSFDQDSSNLITIVADNYLDKYAITLMEETKSFFNNYENEMKIISEKKPVNKLSTLNYY